MNLDYMLQKRSILTNAISSVTWIAINSIALILQYMLRPGTISNGTHKLIGTDLSNYGGAGEKSAIPPKLDVKAAKRFVDVLSTALDAH